MDNTNINSFSGTSTSDLSPNKLSTKSNVRQSLSRFAGMEPLKCITYW